MRKTGWDGSIRRTRRAAAKLGTVGHDGAGATGPNPREPKPRRREPAPTMNQPAPLHDTRRRRGRPLPPLGYTSGLTARNDLNN
ncbi:hypothetical protein LC55x_5072 [Lysobacter capsici]|nr:hypothetical protein LC55x_5072 [Lysobacter capsici]